MTPSPLDRDAEAPASPHSLATWLPRIALVLAAGPLSTLAQSGLPHGLPEEVRRADLDGDGALSIAEAATLRGPIRDHFNEIDTDHDGRVTWAEIDVGMQAHPPPGKAGAQNGRPSGGGTPPDGGPPPG